MTAMGFSSYCRLLKFGSRSGECPPAKTDHTPLVVVCGGHLPCSEPANRGALGRAKTVSGVDREQPELVDVRRIQRGEHRIVRPEWGAAVARHNLVSVS
jgi:hypothetical protein